MHEMGVVINIIDIAEKHAKANGAQKVERIVLQIGELSSVVPEYVRIAYPAAIENTMLSDAELVIEIIPANAICLDCNAVYNLIQNEYACPKCQSGKRDFLGGRDLLLKEIAII